MRHLLIMLTVGAALAALPVRAAPMTLDLPSGRYVSDPAHTSVTWKLSHFGLSYYTARFTKIDATVELDAADVAKSTLAVTIDANSVKTDFPFPDKVDFNAEIGGDDKFLNGKAFPEIKFVSTAIVPTGPRTAKITGNLTLRGVTKPMTLDATLNGAMASHPMLKIPIFGVSATGTVKRSDFGMTYGDGVLGNEVKLLIEAEFRKAS